MPGGVNVGCKASSRKKEFWEKEARIGRKMRGGDYRDAIVVGIRDPLNTRKEMEQLLL